MRGLETLTPKSEWKKLQILSAQEVGEFSRFIGILNWIVINSSDV